MKKVLNYRMIVLCVIFLLPVLSGGKEGACYAQECNIIYVTPTGATSGTAGTRANPADLNYGLALSSPSENLIWLATGTYPVSSIVSIPSNITIEGGFNPAGWIKSNVSQSIIERDASNILASPVNALVALAGNAVSNFRLQDITINVANAPGNQISVYGIYLAGCSNYNITRCTITTGSGSGGLPGTTGTAGAVGGNGSAGLPAADESSVPAGGAGGIGTSGNNGGNGGAGAKHSPNGTEIGASGLTVACGGIGGAGGDGPACGCGLFGTSYNNSCSGSSPVIGQVGGAGTIGTSGTVGPVGTVIGGYWVPGGVGGNGTIGLSGCGGGGGGGGAGRQQDGPDDVGGSGGGGGAGGEGGTSGTGGSGGGSSYGIFLFTNGAGGIIQDCLINPGAAGLGGAGGAGGAGAAGGSGGTGGTGFGCGNSIGANGGAGGAGGTGGTGGAGADGMSIALSENGGTPASNLGITLVPGNPPDINVANKGCINSEVIFSSTTAGAWNFGAGANPATANGTGPFSVYYSTMGRKNIDFNGTTFTDFVTIFQVGLSAPGITPANPTVTAGCNYMFSSSIAGSYYQWIFGSIATPDTAEGPVMQQVMNVSFASAGTYTVYIFVTTACCGKVLDSTIVTVNPSSFNVSLTAAPTSSCEGDPVIFTASPAGFPVYDFSINGNSVQSGIGDTYSTSTLLPGDSIVVVAYTGTCYTNPSAVLYPNISPVPAILLISSDADSTICEGDTVIFTAIPSGYTNYEFFDGTTSVQNSTSSSYTTTTLLPGNSITAVGTNTGCTGNPSEPKVTTVNPAPQIILSSSDADNILCGAGQSITFTASPSGFTNYEFFNNGTSIQSGTSNIYTTSTLTNGSSIQALATSSSGCVGPISNAILTNVNPVPNAWLGSSDPDNTICENEAITFTSIPAGYSSYEFFNAGISVQNSSSNTFITTLNSGNSITVIATNLGCPSAISNSITVIIIPADAVNAGNDFSACINETAIVLIGATPTNGTWTGQGITNPAGLFDPATAGTGAHKLVYAFTNTNSCTGYDTIFAVVHSIPVITIAPDVASVCAGFSIPLSASGANTYAWSPPSGLSAVTGAVVSASPSAATSYTVIGASNNCADTASVTVNVFPIPTVTISGLTSIGTCESTVLSAFPSSSGTYSWGPPVNMICNTCQAVTVSPPVTQNYYVTYTSPDGCADSDTVTVSLESIYNYFMPTGFSPNGDGINDSLHVHGRGIESISLKIFDRIGERVFESTAIEFGWDGTFRGAPMNGGTFVYILEVKYCNGETVKEQGSLMLVR